MFQNLRHRLLVSYLVVLASILSTFAIGVRVVFTRSLTHQLTERLSALGQGAAANAEFDHGRFRVGEDFSTQDLTARGQAIQWFDSQGKLLNQEGKAVVSLPLATADAVQIQTGQPRLQAVTLPILGSDDQQLLGYVRVSQSLAEVDENLQKLDLGLGGGILLALLLSGLGGLWLTRQAMQPIEASFQRLQQFTADAAHELRSPLMVIKSNAAVALKYPEAMRPTDREKFAAIASATSQMTKLTEDLLLLARTEKDTQTDGQTFNLTPLLTGLLQQYVPQAAAKQLHFKSHVAESLAIKGDAAQLTCLVDNLIANALHYTAAGGTIAVQASQLEHTLVITVQDTGMGIAPEHLERVFDRFWRADASRSYWDGGSGLGLAIAQAIAHAHDGSITVSSQLGVGSCFTVRLPAV
ncbi:sensor histidine kinase [Stenomitos frigidus]|uniref:histidine kinase n=1 Tax=Stenomitos frigidus ULC18 TaxID=2107698 RepID=A0A2T1E0Z5_9CYAN|nr:HAMP domain-containing sensor histidine kinase [Stenomitos frigidus]PSB26399.1 two-component sensor histidine kinase [Stenomitos frigidus ULC18]